MAEATIRRTPPPSMPPNAGSNGYHNGYHSRFSRAPSPTKAVARDFTPPSPHYRHPICRSNPGKGAWSAPRGPDENPWNCPEANDCATAQPVLAVYDTQTQTGTPDARGARLRSRVSGLPQGWRRSPHLPPLPHGLQQQREHTSREHRDVPVALIPPCSDETGQEQEREHNVHSRRWSVVSQRHWCPVKGFTGFPSGFDPLV